MGKHANTASHRSAWYCTHRERGHKGRRVIGVFDSDLIKTIIGACRMHMFYSVKQKPRSRHRNCRSMFSLSGNWLKWRRRATETSKSVPRVCLMCAEGEPCECASVRARARVCVCVCVPSVRGEVARSRKDKRKAAMSGGAPDPFERSSNLIRS